MAFEWQCTGSLSFGLRRKEQPHAPPEQSQYRVVVAVLLPVVGVGGGGGGVGEGGDGGVGPSFSHHLPPHPLSQLLPSMLHQSPP